MARIWAGITVTGMSVPEKVLTNFQLEKIVDTSDEWIRTRSGIERRHIAPPDKTTSDYATEAAQQALARRGLDASKIDLIILATVTGDFLTPPTSAIIQDRLGAVNAAVFDLSAGCTGWVEALAVAHAFVVSGKYKHVLVIGAELLSRIANYTDRSTCVLFGDGAGAALVEEVDQGFGILDFHLSADGSKAEWLYIPAGGAKEPLTAESLVTNKNKLVMMGNDVFKFAVKAMEDEVKLLVDRAGLTMEDIDWLGPHQANIRIIEAAAKKLGIPMGKVLLNIKEFGNTSVASIPMVLHQSVDSGKIKRGDNIILVAIGAGLTSGAVLTRWAY